MLGVATHPASQEGNGRASYPATARFRAANPPGNRARPCRACPRAAPDPAVFADAVARYRALERLRGFRQSLYECLDARADALFELADAVLCADHAVTSLVQLCLEPEFTRGHGALYDALSAGRIDDERFFSLLASELPQAVDGPEARAWIAEHDVIDHGLLEKALAGLPAEDAAQVRDACARWARLRFAVDATAYPRPDAWCSPGREHVHNGACHCKGSSKTAPGWEYQLTAAIGHLRTAWAALVDVARTVPATRTAQTIAQVKSVLRRLRAAGHGMKAAPLFVFDAGYSAAALTDGLLGCPVHVLVRLAAGSVFYADPVTWEGRYGRPARRGAAVHCLEPADFTAAAAGSGPRGRKKPLPPNPEPGETLVLAGYPALRHRPGRGLALTCIPSSTATAAGSPAGRTCRSCAAPSSTSPSSACPTAATRTAPCGYGTPAPAPCPSTSSGAPTSPGSTSSMPSSILKGTLGLTAAKVRAPEQADRWVRLLMAAHAQLLLATAPGRRSPAALGETARSRPAAGPGTGPPGVSQHPPRAWGHPPVSRNPPAPAPAGPKAAAKAQHPATFSPAKPTCRAQRKRR